MPPLSKSHDYKVGGAGPKSASPRTNASARPVESLLPLSRSKGELAAHGRPEGPSGVEEFLHLLSRAVRQFHTYPSTSPLCVDAVASCHKAFAALDRHDRLVLRVTPHELIADETGIGRGTIVEHELVRRLHRAKVASLEIDRAASPRDFTRLCADVIRCDDLAKTRTTFAELLAEDGVETIVPHMANRPEVLDLGARPAPIWDLVERDRKRRDAASAAGPASFLYPPDKGWVRLEAAANAETISLVDLAMLVGDPAELATMLLRLTDDAPEATAPGLQDFEQSALEQKFTDVAMLVAALEPHVAQVMLDKLARAVLAIEPGRRNDLLRRTILPGLLDGRPDGAVLRGFPDADLADSLCLLLELETAAPEVLTAALNRLDLPADRRRTLVSLVDRRLQAGPSNPNADHARQHSVDQFARRLVLVDSAPGKSFGEFAAFDLSIDDQAAAAIARVCQTVSDTDVVLAQIDCLWRIVRLEPNPTLVESFLRRALTLFGELEGAGRWRDLAAVASRYRQLAHALKPARPDVADAIARALCAFCNERRAHAVFEQYERDADGRAVATQLIEAFGASLAPGFAALVDDPALQPKLSSLTLLLCERAAMLAPGLVTRLGGCSVVATRVIVRVCGFAGAGYEPAVAGQLTSDDESTVREALRALARMGTARAAALVGAQVQNGSPVAQAAAAEALWHLPHAQMVVQLRALLQDHDFVGRNPHIVARIIDRAAKTRATGLEDALEELEALRFRFWNPGLVRVALKARDYRDR